MTLRRRLTNLLLLGSLVAAGLVTTAAPAAADHHVIKIREVGPDVQGGADFIELQMYSSGQNQVQGHELLTYDESGSLIETYSIPTDVMNGANQATILFATSGFTLTTPDFGDLANGMSTSRGAVCFRSTTLGLIDCVEWGASEVPAVSADPPAPAPGPGQSLERKITAGCATALDGADDKGSSDTDFAIQASPNPEPNSSAPNETLCSGGGGGGAFSLSNLKTKVKGGRARISGKVNPPAPGEKVKLTFFANGSPLRKLSSKSATLNASSGFKKRFKVPSDSTRCKVVVRFKGAKLGQKKFRC
jgi:hypothetical protein